jgi:hypothetical protein
MTQLIREGNSKFQIVSFEDIENYKMKPLIYDPITKPFNFSNFRNYLNFERFENKELDLYLKESETNTSDFFSKTIIPKRTINVYFLIEDSVFLPNEGFLKSISIDFNMTDSYVEDIEVSDTAPNGKRIILHELSNVELVDK